MKKHHIERESIYYIDYEDSNSLVKVVTEYLSSSLFEKSKLIFLRNTDFFSKKTKAKKDILLKIRELFDNETDNIVILQTKKLNVDNPSYIKWIDKIQLIEMNSPEGKKLEIFIKDYFEKNNIPYSFNVIKRIIEMTEGDFDHLISEINKLSLIGEKVTIELIEEVLLDKKGESIFTLVDAVFSKDSFKISSLIDKLKIQDIGAFLILQMLITDLSFMLAIKKMKINMSESDILKKLKLNPYRFRLMISKMKRYEILEMDNLLTGLIKLEKQIKTNSPSDQYEIIKAKIISIN